MKLIYCKLKGKSLVSCLMIVIFLFLLYACGSDDNGDGSGSNGGGTGSLSFTLSIQDKRVARDVQLLAQVSSEGIYCELHEINEIEAYVIDETGSEIARGGPWPCDQHSGTIAGVPTGDDREIIVTASGETTLMGKSKPCQVKAGILTDAGFIELLVARSSPPTSGDETQTNEDVAVTIAVLSNDQPAEYFNTDGDYYGSIDPKTVKIEKEPSKGKAEPNADGAVRYTPDENSNGYDSFWYSVRDDFGSTSEAKQVTVEVIAINDPPVADDDPASTLEDNEVTILVLEGDTDVDGDTLSVSVVTQGSNGMVTSYGSFLNYAPDANFNGLDSFSYTVSDGTATDDATVTVTVTSVNDPPIAGIDSFDEIQVFSVDNELDVLANDDDPVEGHFLTISAYDTSTLQGGSVTINGSGDRLLYTPAAGFFGEDEFNYTVTDAPGPSLTPMNAEAKVIVNVIATITRVNVNSDGVQAAGGDSRSPSISSAGRFIAFASFATNLAVEDTDSYGDIFVHDRLTGSTELVSVNLPGTDSDASSLYPSINADGQIVAFQSNDTNLVSDDTNGNSDIFVRDRSDPSNPKTELISVALDGDFGNDASFSPSISANGQIVAFASNASNLAVAATDTNTDVFVRDRSDPSDPKTELVSVSLDSSERDESLNPSISADGQFVAFESYATNLVAEDTDFFADVLVRDRDRSEPKTSLISVKLDGSDANGDSSFPSISGDGKFVAFQSEDTNLVSDDTNNLTDSFVRNLSDDITERVGVDVCGEVCERSSISSDGRFVAFVSFDNDLVDEDTNTEADIFVYDRQATGRNIAIVSVASDGSAGNDSSSAPSISSDGRYISFQSWATNLVEPDNNENTRDIYVAPNPLY